MFRSFFTLTILFSSIGAYAATSATLLLKGNVPEIMSIQVSPETLATNLPLSQTQTSAKVAVVQEKSNSNTGYKVTIGSANNGKLVRNTGTEQFPYSLSYNSQTLNLASPVVISNPGASAVTRNRDVAISYTGVPEEQLVAGDYSDTITFTISAN